LGTTGIRSIMKDVLRGIEEMHTAGWVHLGLQYVLEPDD